MDNLQHLQIPNQIQNLKFEFRQDQLKNLLIFLDRSGTRNFQELEAMNQIINILKNPIIENEIDKK